MTESRFIVGIDLGTTNIVVSYIDTEKPRTSIQQLPIPQLVAPGEVETPHILPSFCYLPAAHEFAGQARLLPWDSDHKAILGVLARNHGARVPKRLIASAKSWLAHAGVDRAAPILPWGSDLGAEMLSPVDVSARYLEHVKEAWNHRFGRLRDRSGSPCTLAEQQIILTIPASFDETARELTLAAARRAGLAQLILLEEPLAAFYAWLHRHETSWQEQIQSGATILVVDIGGGTTDFSLIEMDHNQKLHRYAVGDHLLLGGDNIDIALAHLVEQRLGTKLEAADWTMACQLCRQAKEELLSSELQSRDVVLLSSGRSVVGNMRTAPLARDQLLSLLDNGFFPRIDRDANVSVTRAGIQKMGLPYAANPAITEHLLHFLRHAVPGDGANAHLPTIVYPHKILLNGGATIPRHVRERLLDVVASWFPDRPRPEELATDNPSLAVAIGAAYYGLVRRGRGVKVRGGISRSYYLEVEDDNGVKTLVCVIPRDTEEGIVVSVPGRFHLQTNRKVRFDLYSSSVRTGDRPGDIVMDRDELSLVAPLVTVVQFGKMKVDATPIAIQCTETEIGALHVELVSQTTEHRWPLQFELRPSQRQTFPASTAGELATITVEQSRLDEALALTQAAFSGGDLLPVLMNQLEQTLGVARHRWSAQILRAIVDAAIALDGCQSLSARHEARWLNLTGFCLRPGFGDPGDELRMRKVWALWFRGIIHRSNPQAIAEWWIFWRRIAPGLKAGHQATVASTVAKILLPRDVYRVALKEGEQAKCEMWRCIGALEALPVKTKLELAQPLLERLAKLQPYEWWVLARIGARRLFHGPANEIVPSAVAASWAEQFMKTPVAADSTNMRLLALTSVGMKTGDRGIDFAPAAFHAVVRFLGRENVSDKWLRRLEGEDDATPEAMEQWIGDSLPAGLRLARWGGCGTGPNVLARRHSKSPARDTLALHISEVPSRM